MRTHRRLASCFCCFVALLLLLHHAALPCRADLWAISSDTPSTFNRLIRFNQATGAALSGGLPTGTPGLARPSGIATGPDGKIYIASRGFDAEGTENDVLPNISSVSCDISGVCGTLTLFADFTAGLDPTEPSGIKFGPDGNLYAAELFYVGGDAVRAYSPSGTRLSDAAGPTIPVGIGFDHENNLLVGTAAVPDFMIPATISRYSGGVPQHPARYVDLTSELAAPSAMLRLENDDLLVVDAFAGRIVRITPAGVLTHFASIPEDLPSAPTFPSDIVFDPDGNLIVSVLGPTNGGDPLGVHGQLLRFNREGALIQTIVDDFEPLAGLTWTNSPLTVAGNFDGIGGVDAADYAKWRADFGKFVAPGNGADGNGNGMVDAADYVIWRKFSTGSGAALESVGVPEPTAAGMVLIGMLLAATSRCRLSPTLVRR
jgi:hypothetical protein